MREGNEVSSLFSERRRRVPALDYTKENLRQRERKAMFLSIIPGVGQVFNRRYIKGFFFLTLFLVFMPFLITFVFPGLIGLMTLGNEIGDDSRTFLIQGIIAFVLLVLYIWFHWFNVRDAARDSRRLSRGNPSPSVREAFQSTWDNGFPIFIIAPGFFMLLFVVVLPLLFMVGLAFTDYNLYNSPPANLLNWVGFENFTTLVQDPYWRESFLSVLSWTVIWTLVATTLQIALALILAVLVNDKRVKFKRVIRTVFILPWAVPGFVTILIFAAMFNDQFGAINRDILSHFDLVIPWLSDPTWTRTALILIQVWLGFPFVFALFTGVLQSISNDWYEAADVDGGSRIQKFRFITFPHVMFATAPLLIMQYAGNFNNFNIIYLFNQGGPPVRGQNAGGTDILISWVYHLTFEQSNFRMAAAISIVIGIVIAVFAFYQFSRTKSFKEEDMY